MNTTTRGIAAVGALELTPAPYLRSHGRQPRGHGIWFLQRATNRAALESQRLGAVLEVQGAQARAERDALSTEGAPLPDGGAPSFASRTR